MSWAISDSEKESQEENGIILEFQDQSIAVRLENDTSLLVSHLHHSQVTQQIVCALHSGQMLCLQHLGST